MLEELQLAEDARFEQYARERRRELVETKRRYAEQLEEFTRERVMVLASGVGDLPGSRRKGKRRPVEVRRLEKVSLAVEAVGGLDEFFRDSSEDGRGGPELQGQSPPGKPTTKKGQGKEKEVQEVPVRGQQPSGDHGGVKPAVILADEDIEDEEEILGHYKR
jgi:hypothetical protein